VNNVGKGKGLDLSVVIVSFNTRQLLDICLASLLADLREAKLVGEVFVVDNASSDGSPEMVRERYPEVLLIASERNLGFAAANNLALRQAQGRYILLLNPDSQIVKGALEKLVSFLEVQPEVGMVGARLLYPDGRFQHSAFKFPTLAMTLFDFFPLNHRIINSRLNGRYPVAYYERPFPIDHPLGAALMVRRKILEQVGFLDERFFIYCEEIDWCVRIKRAGWQIWCVPEAQVIHHEAQSTGQFREAMFVELFKSRYLLFAKHYGGAYQWAARQIVRLGLLRKMLQDRWWAWRGKLAKEDFEARLGAYGEVFRM